MNLMPRSVYIKLGLTEMKPTRVMLQLQLADRCVKFPCGFVEDMGILVKTTMLILPSHVFVLDMKKII